MIAPILVVLATVAPTPVYDLVFSGGWWTGPARRGSAPTWL